MADALNKLTIKGFKSIKDLTDFELTSLNVIIGGNGAGKSNLISFFRMLRAITEGSLNRYVEDNGGAGDLLFNGRKITKLMEFETRFGTGGYRFSLLPTPKDTCSLENETEFSATVREAISSWRIYHFHDTGSTAGMRHYEIVQDNKVLRTDAANIGPFLLKLKTKNPDVYKQIRNAVGMVAPFFDDFLLEPQEAGAKVKVNISWTQKGSDYPMQPYHFSDGTIRFVCLAAALLQPAPPSTIIIDEPELGLHPAAIAILAELIEVAAGRTQVIIATQSPTFIDHFGVEDVVVVNRENGASTFKRLNEADLSEWLESYSVGELWTKNVIAGGPVYEGRMSSF